MATKGKFHVPSAEEMAIDSERITAPKPQSLFSAHRKTVQENIAKEKNKSPTKPSSIQSQTESVQSKSAIITKSNECISRPLVQKKDGPTVDTLQTPAPVTSAVTTTSVAGGGLSKENPTKEQNRQEKDAPPRSSNPQALVVSARQRGNPILKSVRNVPWEFGDIVADYQMGPTTCAIFLSLRYHNLNPNYVHERLKQLGHSYNLRVLLVQVDIKDPTHCLKELAKMCILADCTLILAFTPEEAGKYLETFKSFENKPPDLIMEKTEGNYLTKVTETLTAVKSINKTDSSTLLHTFGSMQDIVEATEEDLSFCPGFGPQKAKRLHNIFHEPFLREKKRKTNTVSPTKKKEPSHSPRKS